VTDREGLGQWALRHWFSLSSVLGMSLLLAYQLALWGWRPADWDWLLVTGLGVFLVAYALSRGFPRRVAETVQRLRDRGVIGDARADPADHDAEVAAVVRDIEERARRYRLVGAPLAAATMALLWIVAFHDVPWRNGALWLNVVLAAVAGGVLGRLVAYGRLGHILIRNGLPPHPQPGHVDNAAGLGPVGDLYLRQATVVAAIGLFAGVWWLLIGTSERYAYWRGPYVAVMLIAVGCEVLAFVAPLWTFHVLMATEHRRLVEDADKTSREIQVLTRERAIRPEPVDRERIDAEVERLTRRWRDIETMPTWPVDARVRRRFTWNNVIVAVPILLKAISAPSSWRDLADGLAGLLK
jgi:hypothetical protein